jgi:hypothetical protein
VDTCADARTIGLPLGRSQRPAPADMTAARFRVAGCSGAGNGQHALLSTAGGDVVAQQPSSSKAGPVTWGSSASLDAPLLVQFREEVCVPYRRWQHDCCSGLPYSFARNLSFCTENTRASI